MSGWDNPDVNMLPQEIQDENAQQRADYDKAIENLFGGNKRKKINCPSCSSHAWTYIMDKTNKKERSINCTFYCYPCGNIWDTSVKLCI